MAAPPSIVEEPSKSRPLTEDVIIRFENVAIAFEDHDVRDGISFTLKKGETKAIFGVAGSGKSTILKMALGLLKPDRRRIVVLRQDMSAMRQHEMVVLR